MIIVDGPDGSGKDTLIANLGFHAYKLKALRGGVGGVKMMAAEGGVDDGVAGWGGDDPALLCYVNQVMKRRGDHMLAFNRFHLSEVVYGPILRGTDELSTRDLDALDSLLRAMDVHVILCLPPFDVTLEQVKRPGRERPAYQTEEFLLHAYNGFHSVQRYATVVYNFTEDPTAASVKRLL